ncbi:BEM_collapsed_G0022760.mRNA.1.CDS.1 [Saccharomyces cerevisiae]|nr:BEM_collapsed_G0022760.mRNA.1.CDS.1 [Saccharomyces cerevisiae]
MTKGSSGVRIWTLFSILFLKYVENPHIERTYGDGIDSGSQMNSRVDDLISKNYDYSRPL